MYLDLQLIQRFAENKKQPFIKYLLLKQRSVLHSINGDYRINRYKSLMPGRKVDFTGISLCYAFLDQISCHARVSSFRQDILRLCKKKK